jgi:hypothetical protein
MKHKDFEIISISATKRNTVEITIRQGAKIELPIEYANGMNIFATLRVSVVPYGGLLGRLKVAAILFRRRFGTQYPD